MTRFTAHFPMSNYRSEDAIGPPNLRPFPIKTFGKLGSEEDVLAIEMPWVLLGDGTCVCSVMVWGERRDFIAV
jgi:hypothetical protein